METQIQVDWEKWEQDQYNKLSFYGKVWHHASNFLIKFSELCERIR